MLDLEDWYLRALDARADLSMQRRDQSDPHMLGAAILESLQLLLEREIDRTRKEIVEGDRG